MTKEGLEYLGAAIWLKNHGWGWLVEQQPEAVVPIATALAEALHRATHPGAEADQ